MTQALNQLGMMSFETTDMPLTLQFEITDMPQALKQLGMMPFETTDMPLTWELLFETTDLPQTLGASGEGIKMARTVWTCLTPITVRLSRADTM